MSITTSSNNINEKEYMNSSVMNWLCQILKERFGIDMILELQEDSTLCLSIKNTKGVITFNTESTRFSSLDTDLPICNWNAVAEGWSVPCKDILPAPGASSLPYPLIEQIKTGYSVHYDILGFTFWMLTRQEEVGRTDLDNHGRFLATSSHAFKYGYLERPIVDEWLNILGQVMQRQWPSIELKKYHFHMKVSHDVDSPSRYWFVKPMQLLRGMGAEIFKRGNMRRALFAPWIRLNSGKKLHLEDPFNTFDWIMDVSEKHSLKSAFYFICGRTDRNLDAVYEIEQPGIRELIRRIHARGHEIGLHPSYNTYLNPQAIVVEAQRLRNVCAEEGIEQSEWGGRMHVLRWEHPTTLYGWEEAGMTYDSTMSYADRAGFRCGTCYEYPAFDPVAGCALNLRIRPLIAMEGTVIYGRYMGLGSGEEALKKFKELKDACRSVNGCFTLLWHNSEFGSLAYRELYQAVLES